MTTQDATLEFWYEFASPYCYLTAARIEALAASAGLRILWRPFLLGPIFRRRPHQPSPSQDAAPDEARYRRRDIERLCLDDGLPLTWPSAFPRISLLGARIGLLAEEEGWAADFVRAVFHASFAEDRDIGAEPVIAAILARLGRDPGALIARATTPGNKARLVAQGDTAMARGIFGAPSFITAGGELFWGNDRLEQAIAWARRAAG
jgi:2-hydroxychromene-2-carboxylate isomerase